MSDYNASDIKVLDSIQAIRKKPGLYAGDESMYLWIAFKEPVDNAIDEMNLQRGTGHEIRIWVDTKRDLYATADTGRGIPVEKNKKTKLSTLTTVFTVAHSSGKFDGEQGATAGTFGVGATVTNAMSKRFLVHTKRDGWYSQTFEKGEAVTDVVKGRAKPPTGMGDVTHKRGTYIVFQPDRTIIPKDAVLDKEMALAYLRLQAAVKPKLSFHLVWDGKETVIAYPKGMDQYIRARWKDQEFLSKSTFHYTSPACTIALAVVADPDCNLVSSVSGATTAKGGTHLKALAALFKEAIGGKKDLPADALMEGVVGVLNVNVIAPSFSGQTKEVLSTKGMDKYVAPALPSLKKWLNANGGELKKIITERAEQLVRAEENRKKSRKLASAAKSTSLPAKLTVCLRARPEDRELYIVEGDSAAGTLKVTRNTACQEVLPLRGKILNVAKAGRKHAHENKEVVDILQSIGYGKDGFAPRVGKVIIAADSDPDGSHIATLVLAVLLRYIPEAIAKNMVHLTAAPLYSYREGKTFYHADTLEELRTKLSKAGVKMDVRKLTRAKGLGELSPDEAKFVLMDPSTRIIRPVSDAAKPDKALFIRLVGDDVSMRKELIGI